MPVANRTRTTPKPTYRFESSQMMRQYQDAKTKHPDMLLLFRVGDFYESFDADAQTLRKTLGLTLTARGETVMAGFPHHQLEVYLRKLLHKGLRVAICDPVESAPVGKPIQRVVTNGDLVSQTPLAAKIAAAPRPHDNSNPLWQGPCAPGPLGGVTQSMLVRFMSCRERFRLKYVLGLELPDKWNKNIGYGNMWHACEEAHAANVDWRKALVHHTVQQFDKYPMQRDEINKWCNVCRTQFPEYVKYWSEHPDVKARTPLMQEQVFDVPYALPSGRTVRLRGKFDSVDLIDDTANNSGGIYLQENKTKGDIDKEQTERQLKFDLQTMVYLIALRHHYGLMGWAAKGPIGGVRYNVVRRPLSGGVGSITPHKGKCTKPTYSKKDGRVLKESKITPAETDAEFYERLRRDYIAADPGYWFFRVRSEVSANDVKVFRETCLDALLEQICWWYDAVTGRDMGEIENAYGYPPLNYRTPFGVWSALEEGGSTEYDSFLASGSEVGLRRVEQLFTELQEPTQ